MQLSLNRNLALIHMSMVISYIGVSELQIVEVHVLALREEGSCVPGRLMQLDEDTWRYPECKTDPSPACLLCMILLLKRQSCRPGSRSPSASQRDADNSAPC